MDAEKMFFTNILEIQVKSSTFISDWKFDFGLGCGHLHSSWRHLLEGLQKN